LGRPVNIVYLVVVGLALVWIECFIGGTRLVYSLPAYGLISIAAILSVFSIRRRRLRTPPDFLCVASTLLMGAWVLARAWNSPVPYLSWPDFFMMLACLMVYLITAFYLTNTGLQTALIVVLWGIAALEVWVGMVQFIHDQHFMLFGLIRPTILRASGMYISPNNFAGFLAAVAVLSASLGIWSRWPAWAKILAFYFSAVCMAGIAISGSRGGYFDIIGSMLCLAIACSYATRVLDPPRFIPVAVASLGALVGVVALVAFLMGHSPYLVHRMQTMVVKDVRIYNWAAALDHIRVNPWFGTGAGTHLIYGRFFRRPEIQADPVHAHCDYLELLAEYGIIGGCCVALFIFAHLRNALHTYSCLLRQRLLPSGFHRSNRFALQLGALCAVLGLAIHSVVDFDMHIPGNALIFAFLFGLLANPAMQRPMGFVDRRLTPWAKFIAPALGLFMLSWGMPLLPAEVAGELARGFLRNHDFLDAIAFAQKGISGVPQLATLPAEDAADLPPRSLLDTALSKTGGDPWNPDLYFYLGEANRVLASRIMDPFMRQRNLERAAAAFNAGLNVFPQDENMLVRYGQVLDGMRQFAAADVLYQRALHWDPNLGAIRTYYESHLTAEGKKAEADAMAADWANYKPAPVDSDSKTDIAQ